MATLVALMLLLGACGGSPTGSAGWQGTDVHLVDGTWIGSEGTCDDPRAVVCNTVVQRGTEAVPADLRLKAKKVVLAVLPTRFVTAGGEPRTANLTAGILSREAIVLDLEDGSRRVIGLWCYLPSSGDGLFLVHEATCEVSPLEFWLDGNAPPSLPPGSTQG